MLWKGSRGNIEMTLDDVLTEVANRQQEAQERESARVTRSALVSTGLERVGWGATPVESDVYVIQNGV